MSNVAQWHKNLNNGQVPFIQLPNSEVKFPESRVIIEYANDLTKGLIQEPVDGIQ